MEFRTLPDTLPIRSRILEPINYCLELLELLVSLSPCLLKNNPRSVERGSFFISRKRQIGFLG